MGSTPSTGSRFLVSAITFLGLLGMAVGIWLWLAQATREEPAPKATSHVVPHAENRPSRQPTVLAAAADHRAEFLRRMNLGKARLENGEYEKAIEDLTAALKLQPKSGPALRNLARAYLFATNLDAAVERLEEAGNGNPESAATTYLLGIARARQLRFADAIPYFEQAARLNPHTAAIRYQLAQAYQATKQEEKTIAQLQETVRLDHQHTAAHFQLAMHARKKGDTEEYRRELREFVRLRDVYGDPSATPLALEACSLTAAEPTEIGSGMDNTSAPPAAITVRFADATEDVFVHDADRSAAAVAVIDMDEHGRYTLFVADHDGHLGLMTLSSAGTFTREKLDLRLRQDLDVQSCVVGNYYDEPSEPANEKAVSLRFPDVMMIGSRGTSLLQRLDRATFRETTRAAGLADLTGRQARWVDYEYDGDLDLLVARKSGTELWQNNGDGTFQNVTGAVGITTGIASIDVNAVDLDANGGVDLMIARAAQPTLVFENQRAGQFAPVPEPPGPWPAAQRVFVNDTNNDGHPDVLLVGATRATIITGKSAARQQIDLTDFSLTAGAWIDYDNDGWLDFCGVGHSQTSPDQGAVRIWRNARGAAWRDITADLALQQIQVPPLRDVVAADFDSDGDTDLLLRTDAGQLRFFHNEGGNQNGQLKLRLTPLMTIRSGIGTRVELRRGDYWVSRSVQQELPIEIGLAGHKQLDTVQTVWTNGVVDNQLNVVAVEKPLDVIILKWIPTGSCPYLYAWDGHRFRFVTDVVGSGALGLSLSRQAVWTPDPHEIVSLGDSDQFRPRSGRYTIKLTSELREASYIDHCKVLVVDHPPSTEIHPTDKFMPPPFSPSQLWALGHPIRPIRAEGDDGIDRTGAVQKIDAVFAPPGPDLPQPRTGVRRPMSLILDFGQIQIDRPLVLALTGWLEYGDASSNIAVSQNTAIDVIWPRLEAETATGNWVALDVNVGAPAGKTKTILCDLAGRLPRGTQRLRLTTTLEIRWDRVALFERQPLDPSRIHHVALRRAELDWHGFRDTKSRGPGQPVTPNDNQPTAQPPWRTTLEGWCTRYGDVRELIAKADGQLAVLNGGDAVTLSFPAEDLPDPPAGSVRTFFLDAVGWNKEDNANTVDGDTIEPLPGNEAERHATGEIPADDWQVRYNTRWVPRHRFAPDRLEQ